MSSHIPVFLASDDAYAPFIATTIASICYNTKEFIDFYILDGGISPFHKKAINLLKNTFSNFSIDFLAVDAQRHFGDFFSAEGITPSAYSRFFIPQLVRNIDKAIYSDVDVICLGDIAEMYEQNLGSFSVGAINHAYFAENKHLATTVATRLLLSNDHEYFYSGNLLIDCKKWREQDISNQLLRIAKQYNTRLLMGDQCVLNKCFEDNNYKQLDYKFCLTTQDCLYFSRHNKEEYSRLSRDVVIRHFETRRKPWLTNLYCENNPIDNFQDFWFFAAMTPFYARLQQQFLIAQNTPLPEIMNNIKKPDENTLATLHAKIAATKRKQ